MQITLSKIQKVARAYRKARDAYQQMQVEIEKLRDSYDDTLNELEVELGVMLNSDIDPESGNLHEFFNRQSTNNLDVIELFKIARKVED